MHVNDGQNVLEFTFAFKQRLYMYVIYVYLKWVPFFKVRYNFLIQFCTSNQATYGQTWLTRIIYTGEKEKKTNTFKSNADFRPRQSDFSPSTMAASISFVHFYFSDCMTASY